MTVAAQRLEMVRANASFAIGEFGALSDTKFGLDRDSVAWVEGFVERRRGRYGNGEAPDGLVSVIGSFLGEAIIAASRGEWHEDADGNLCVIFSGGDCAYPFTKVAKQFEQGLEAGESILSFYDISVNYVALGRLGTAAAGKAGETS
jgi:hypothetical protein